MPVVDVKNLRGETVGQVTLADSVFAAKVNPYLLHEAARWVRAGERRGTHKVKGRSEVSGSGKKLWRQKGTGRARMGSIRSPLWRHGGTVHGPVPRDYSFRLPRKMVLGALRSALSAKVAEQKLTVVEAWSLESHKTKPFRQTLSKLDAASRTLLLVERQPNRNLELASRNLEGVKRVVTHDLQPYDLLRHEGLILSKDAALKLSAALSPEGTEAAAPDVTQIAPAPEPPAAEKKPARATKKTAAAKAPSKKTGKKKEA
jgi:large subunit ribosomal protein L4